MGVSTLSAGGRTTRLQGLSQSRSGKDVQDHLLWYYRHLAGDEVMPYSPKQKRDNPENPSKAPGDYAEAKA
jgi:hypothetical protein